jgi:hypothetical protein
MAFLLNLRDLLASLEMAVDHVIEACSQVECLTETDCMTVLKEENDQPGNLKKYMRDFSCY